MVEEQEATRMKQILQKCMNDNLFVPREEDWVEDEDGRPAVNLGKVEILEEGEVEDEGIFAGEQGHLRATVVGAQKYNNEHVAFYFKPDYADEYLMRIHDLSGIDWLEF
jgi:hypothetical protein